MKCIIQGIKMTDLITELEACYHDLEHRVECLEISQGFAVEYPSCEPNVLAVLKAKDTLIRQYQDEIIALKIALEYANANN